MGAAPSTREYHHNGERGKFLTSRDFFVKRYVQHDLDTVLHQFYGEYVRACAQYGTTQLNFQPNEDFQQSFELIDINPFERLRATQSVVTKYKRDVLGFAVTIVDELSQLELPEDGSFTSHVGATNGTPADRQSFLHRKRSMSKIQQAVEAKGRGRQTATWAHDDDTKKKVAGQAFVEVGFFFFLWNTVAGEKFGRNEVKACRTLAELFNQNVRVPLAYHIRYKGRSVTALGLCPVSENTHFHDIEVERGAVPTAQDASTFTEWDVLSMEIACALKLRSYEKNGRAYFTPPDVQRHNGLDGRRYFVANSFWLPRLPPPNGRRQSSQQYYAVMRPVAIVNAREQICVRSFRATSMVHDDRSTIHALSRMIDVDIHHLMKVDVNIIAEFRKRGYNYSLLGVLLVSVLRNVNPPPNVVDFIIAEMMARGVADYINDVTCPIGDPARLRQAVEAGATGAAETQAAVGALDVGMDLVGESARFYGTAQSILMDVLEYEGDPHPTATETGEDEGPGLPLNTYGGMVIPHIYRKFRLTYDDVDLFQAWSQPMRRTIFGRAAQLLGLRVKDGIIKDAMPILGATSSPSDAIAPWCRTRLRTLADGLLLRPLAPRTLWEQHGPGLILLLRLNPAYWQYYDVMNDNLARTDLPYIDEHSIAVSPHLQELEDYVDEEWAEQRSLAPHDFDVQRGATLIQLIRHIAAAMHDVGRQRDALHSLRRGRRLCERIFEKGHSVLFSPQFRSLSQQLREYSAFSDLSPLTEMLRLTLKHCPLDLAVSFDYVTVAFAQLAIGQREEASENLSRARHIASQYADDDDPKLLVLIANEAQMMKESGDLEGAAAHIRPVTGAKTCPPAVLRLASDIFAALGEPETAFAVTIRAEHIEDSLLAAQTAIEHAVAPTGGPPGSRVSLSAPELTFLRKKSIIDTMKEKLGMSQVGRPPGEEGSTEESDGHQGQQASPSFGPFLRDSPVEEGEESEDDVDEDGFINVGLPPTL